jgi:tight adherence protein B
VTAVVLAALGVSVGAVGMIWALQSGRAPRGELHVTGSTARWFSSVGDRLPAPMRLVAVAGIALLVALGTGWPVGGLLAGIAAAGLPALWAQTATSRFADRHDALATWTEMLRDTLHASVGLSQAIVATAPVAPVAIRPAVVSLSDRLVSGVPMVGALRHFADDLDDASADVVVCALILAASARSQRLADLLGTLAASTRDGVAMALRVDAQRASTRSGVRIVVAFSVGFVALLAVVAHSYLSPFATPTGQLVLLLAGIVDGIGVWLFARMTREVEAPRLLGPPAARLAGGRDGPESPPVNRSPFTVGKGVGRL